MKKTGKLFSLSMILIVVATVTLAAYYSYINMGGPEVASASFTESQEAAIVSEVKEITMFIWEDYISDKALADFDSKYGITVNVEYYEDEETMLAGVMSDPGKYDLIIASGLYVANMAKMKLLSRIDHGIVTNLLNINNKFLNPPYDRNHDYSVPYMWGTTGLVINTKYIKEDNPGWEVLFDEQYAGRLAMINDPMECMAVALVINGYSINSNDPAELGQAAEMLINHKAMNYQFLSEMDITEKMLNEEIWAALTYGGEIIQETEGMDEFVYIIPEAGYSVWVDNMCIPASSEHKEVANMLINHILDAQVSAEIASSLLLANTNLAAAKYTDAKVMSDKRLYPSALLLRKGQAFSCDEFSLEKQQIYNKTWQTLNAD
ncbi:MAG: spermidine/putrescine ABC transporter substrate-binding protein [Sedimentisphaerales bacterium]|nr:spermidine/putrescine ABC transporter substrate-binding protein [Sedimentisphaerales bacterium]MBN2841798.1 spermidine/putrescine ABC transporter substrate-binding protein [Sedimentisphaerales bacterium]